MIVSVRGRRYVAEVAVTPEEHARWLSGRESVPDGTGMLFVFAVPEKVPLWNRGMSVPVDAVWIGSDSKIVHAATLPSEKNGETVEIFPDSPALFVLEVPAGEILSQGFRPGDPVTVGDPFSE